MEHKAVYTQNQSSNLISLFGFLLLSSLIAIIEAREGESGEKNWRTQEQTQQRTLYFSRENTQNSSENPLTCESEKVKI